MARRLGTGLVHNWRMVSVFNGFDIKRPNNFYYTLGMLKKYMDRRSNQCRFYENEKNG